jgi:hypothetical protein
MGKQALAILMSLLLTVAFFTNADAKVYKRIATAAPESSPPVWAWPYFPPVPQGAYVSTVVYGPGNRRCYSQLIQLPNRWWRPLVRCE